MFLTNIRFGFATNSSSTHSIIISHEKIPDKLNDYFGWDFFTASSNQAKRQYLASILYNHLSYVVDESIAHDLIKYWLDIDMTDTTLCLGVDHQSMPLLPKTWEGLSIDVDFFNDYKNFILNEHVVILGGNDNDDEAHPRGLNSFVLPLWYDNDREDIVARKDNKYDYWSLYSRKSGTKVRLKLDRDQPPITKSYAPELVDLKITDYCTSNCKFCYQDSTKKGEHGDIYYIQHVLSLLSQHKVFEVAIGGGEPIEYPYLNRVLQECKYRHIVPNFTTKNIKWLEDDDKRKFILDHIGGFSYSITNARDVKKLGMLLEKYKINSYKIQVQIIEGVISEQTFYDILKECSRYGITLVILGFKVTGRGKQFLDSKNINNINIENWFNIINKAQKEKCFVSIGIDTIIAQKYHQFLLDQGIDKLFFTTQEGQFSCYIDAVTQQIGRCSYEQETMKDFKSTDFNKFLTYFEEF